MFRALLWKEWRELWALAVLAVPLAGISLLFTKGYYNRLDPVIWDSSFGLWLSLAAIYIPSHLYTREQEAGTSQFLFSRPLDRFRLWWIRLFIGLSILLVLAALLFCTVQIMSQFYLKPRNYESQRDAIVLRGVYYSLFCLGLSTFLSAFSKRQITVFTISIVGLGILSVVQYRGRWSGVPMSFPDYEYYVPVLLFAGLVIFARRNLWRVTRLSVMVTYTVLAVFAFAPIVAHAVHETSLKRKASEGFLVAYPISEDGRFAVVWTAGKRNAGVQYSRMQYLVNTDSGSFMTVDYPFETVLNCRKMLVWKRSKFSPSSLTLMDMNGKFKKKVYAGRWFDRYPNMPAAKWSDDGKYFGLAENAIGESAGYVFIADAEGKQLTKYVFPRLEMVQLWPIGWDSQERLYFRKSNARGKSYWRMSPTDAAPERVLIPQKVSREDDWFRGIYGDWLDCSKFFGNKWTFLFYNVATTAILSLKNADSVEMARDGSMLAYLQKIPGNDDEAPSAYTLVVQAPPGQEAFSLDLPPPYRYGLGKFSRSNNYLLLFQGEKRKKDASSERWKIRVFSLVEQKFIDVARPMELRFPRWIADDRLLWTTGRSLIVTEADGSKRRELLRLEGNKVVSAGRGKK